MLVLNVKSYLLFLSFLDSPLKLSAFTKRVDHISLQFCMFKHLETTKTTEEIKIDDESYYFFHERGTKLFEIYKNSQC